jgi:uncharacterized RDD family membrane protein YckC
MNHPWSSAYGSFTRRALARLVDLGVVLAPCGALYLINRALGFPVRYTSLFNFVRPDSATMFMSTDFPGFFLTYVSIKVLLAFPYFALMESSEWMGTLGKRFMGIKVTDLDGRRISFGRAAGRYFLKSVSTTLLMLGYLVSFSDKRQTWHDYIARTLVLRKDISPAYYVLPRVPSRWMFDVPGFSNREEVQTPGYVCVSCNYQSDEKHLGCPACGRQFGYVEVGVLRGLLVMNGMIFTLLGGFLSYLAFSITSERLIDDSLGRDGAPWGIIFIIFVAASACVSGGLCALFGQRWPLRAMLTLAVGLARR